MRPWHSAVFWWLVFLCAAEAVARVLSPYADIPRAAQVVRNPAMTRGWPEYVDGPKADQRPLVVLITHSQGVGRELEDASQIYPALVREQLRPVADFEAWACGGLRTAEAESLLLAATKRRARLTVLALAPTNLDRRERLSLRLSGTDATLLALDPRHLAAAQQTTAWQQTSLNDLMTLAGRRTSALLRSRTALEDLLAPRLPLAWSVLVAGQRIPPVERLDNLVASGSAYWGPPDEALLNFRSQQQKKGREQRTYSRQDLERRLDTLRQLARASKAAMSAAEGEILWVWTPFDKTKISTATQPHLENFFAQANAILARHGFPVMDLHAAIPSQRFLTAGHLDAQGHAQLAAAMNEAIADALR